MYIVVEIHKRQATLPNKHAPFLPRCMECRRGLAMGILSVCLSVRLSVYHTRAL